MENRPYMVSTKVWVTKSGYRPVTANPEQRGKSAYHTKNPDLSIILNLNENPR